MIMATQNLAIMILLPLIIILVLTGIVYLVMRSSREKPTYPSSSNISANSTSSIPAEYSDTSREALKIRYVKGEIDEKEYREIKTVLEE